MQYQPQYTDYSAAENRTGKKREQPAKKAIFIYCTMLLPRYILADNAQSLFYHIALGKGRIFPLGLHHKICGFIYASAGPAYHYHFSLTAFDHLHHSRMIYICDSVFLHFNGIIDILRYFKHGNLNYYALCSEPELADKARNKNTEDHNTGGARNGIARIFHSDR